jgi:hypothetical protein
MQLQSSKSSLSPARRRLVELMQDLNFGRIKRLEVQGGQPVFDPPLRIVREIKFGALNGPRPEAALRDFVLKALLVEFFTWLDMFGDGVIGRLEVQHGLPFRIVVEQSAA